MFTALARITRPDARTVDKLIESYLTHGTADLASQTVSGYRKKAKPIKTVFGELAPDDITSAMVAQYLELRKTDNKSVAGNREAALLSSAFSYGMRNGLCSRNPCYGVKRNKERPRSYYITDAEFNAAIDASPKEFGNLLTFAYLTGWRQADCIALDWNAVTKEGITLTEQKTGKQLVITWTKALRKAVGKKGTGKVFRNTQGDPWTGWAVQSQMRRLNVPWTFHDLRAKAESDHASGLGLMALYRRARRIKPVK